MQQEVKNGLFREDLFYRVNVFPLQWLPLSQRPKDILPLAEYFILRYQEDELSSKVKLTKAAIEKLQSYAWPGNGRELENVIQRALIMAKRDRIGADDIQFEVDNMLKKQVNA